MRKYNSEILLLTKTKHADDLLCWLEWHLNIVHCDHVVLLDNESPIDVQKICDMFPPDKIEYKKIVCWPDQYNLYNECLKACESNWVITLDDDEYLYIGDKYKSDVNTFLQEIYEKYHKNKVYILWNHLFSPDYMENKTYLLINTHTMYSYQLCGRIVGLSHCDNGLGKCFHYMGDNNNDDDTNISNNKYYYHTCDGKSIGHIPDCLNGDNETILETGDVVKKEWMRQGSNYNPNCFIAHYQYRNAEDWRTKCMRRIACPPAVSQAYKIKIYKKIYELKDLLKPCTLLKDRWDTYTKNKDCSIYKQLADKPLIIVEEKKENRREEHREHRNHSLFKHIKRESEDYIEVPPIEYNKTKTIVIAAMICCGKTTFTKNSNGYSVLDLDDLVENHKIDLSELYEEKEYYTVRQAYMKKLESCLGKYDIILVSVKDSVLYSLRNRKIPYVLCYPVDTEENMKEWEKRNRIRGTFWLWQKIRTFWHEMMRRLSNDKYCAYRVELKSNEYLSDYIEDIVTFYNKHILENKE